MDEGNVYEIDGDTYDPYWTIPPIPYANKKTDPRQINQFIKHWKEEDKYTGDQYDLLDEKVRMFYSICRSADILPEHFHVVFPYILKGRAREHFMHKVNGTNATFAQIYQALQNRFDTDANRMHYYTDWTIINFKRIKKEHPEMTHRQVLDKLVNSLERCQRALGEKDAGSDFTLRIALIIACRGVPELAMALYRPVATSDELIADLRFSIENTSLITAE